MRREEKIVVSPIGQGIYTLSEVARLTRTRLQRIRSWFMGRKGGPAPILGCGGRWSHGHHADTTVSFHSLIDALVVARLRDCGVTMQYLRKIHGALVKELSEQHPFSRKDIYTDGKKVLIGYADKLGYPALRELLTRQHSFPKILEDYLMHVEYDEDTLLALRWRVSEGVVIDPGRRYGKPIVEACGVPTAILRTAYRANDEDVDLVAEWYGVSQANVARAVAFEESLSSHAA